MTIPALYHSWILWIGDGTGLPNAILHIHAGLAILLVVRLVSGRSLATFIPFGVVILAEFGNELMDYLVYGMRWADTLLDVGNTLFWPLVISLAVRLASLQPISLRCALVIDHAACSCVSVHFHLTHVAGSAFRPMRPAGNRAPLPSMSPPSGAIPPAVLEQHRAGDDPTSAAHEVPEQRGLTRF